MIRACGQHSKETILPLLRSHDDLGIDRAQAAAVTAARRRHEWSRTTRDRETPGNKAGGHTACTRTAMHRSACATSLLHHASRARSGWGRRVARCPPMCAACKGTESQQHRDCRPTVRQASYENQPAAHARAQPPLEHFGRTSEPAALSIDARARANPRSMRASQGRSMGTNYAPPREIKTDLPKLSLSLSPSLPHIHLMS